MATRITLFLLLLQIQTASGQILVTGVAQGTANTAVPGTIELYAFEQIPDLSIYSLEAIWNATPDGPDFFFPAFSISPGTFIYITCDADQFQTFYGFPPTFEDSVGCLAGGYPVLIWSGTTAVSAYGDIAMIGGGCDWEYTDSWAYRFDNRTDENWGPGCPTVPSGYPWTMAGVGALLDAETNATAQTPFPIGSYSLDVVSNKQTSFGAIKAEYR